MKCPLTIAILAVGLQVAGAQEKANIGSLNLEAHETGSVSSFNTLWEMGVNDYDRDNHQAKKLLVTVRDLSRKVPQVAVQIFFIGCDQKTGYWLISKRVDVPVALHGLIEVTGYVQSPLVKSNEKNYSALGEFHASGVKLVGWIVRGLLNEQIFQIRASDQTLLQIAEGDRRQSFSLNDLIANYEKKSHSSDRHPPANNDLGR